MKTLYFVLKTTLLAKFFLSRSNSKTLSPFVKYPGFIPKDRDHRIPNVKTIILKYSYPLEIQRLDNYFRDVEEIIFNNSRFSDEQLDSMWTPIWSNTIWRTVTKLSINYEKYVCVDNKPPKISISTCAKSFPMLQELKINKVLQCDGWHLSMEPRIVRLKVLKIQDRLLHPQMLSKCTYLEMFHQKWPKRSKEFNEEVAKVKSYLPHTCKLYHVDTEKEMLL